MFSLTNLECVKHCLNLFFSLLSTLGFFKKNCPLLDKKMYHFYDEIGTKKCTHRLVDWENCPFYVGTTRVARRKTSHTEGTHDDVLAQPDISKLFTYENHTEMLEEIFYSFWYSLSWTPLVCARYLRNLANALVKIRRLLCVSPCFFDVQASQLHDGGGCGASITKIEGDYHLLKLYFSRLRSGLLFCN